tara:strand:- start:92 stop:811 length:720 start_codon:yes stop_codon:yes gene_type:complete
MNYKQKYLKYKLKYLNLKKKMFGGMEGDIDNSLSPEIILREHLSLCDDELADKIINEAGDNIDEYFDEYNKALEKIFKLNISDKDKIDIENKVTNTLKKISEKQNNKAIQAVKRSECAKVEAKQLAEKSNRKKSEAEVAEAEAIEAISSATAVAMSSAAAVAMSSAAATEAVVEMSSAAAEAYKEYEVDEVYDYEDDYEEYRDGELNEDDYKEYRDGELNEDDYKEEEKKDLDLDYWKL